MGTIQVAADAAEAMRPLAGDYAFILFAFGLFNASLFAASILPLSTSYTVCEGLGLESGVDKNFKEAPFFYWLYTLLIVGGSATVLLLPDSQLMNFAILSQVLNGVLLPVVIILMMMETALDAVHYIELTHQVESSAHSESEPIALHCAGERDVL